MDLSQFEMTQDAVFVQLRHPKTKQPLFMEIDGKQDESLPIGVEIFGADSEQFKRHRRRLQNMAIEAQTRRKSSFTAEEIDTETQSTLAACIHAFRNVHWKGEELKAPKDNMLFIKMMPWATDQIDEAMADRSRFMPALSKIS